MTAAPDGQGALAENILHFARTLRAAGLPVGPGSVLDAVAAIEATGFSQREDFRAALHAVFVKKHEHTPLFDQAFDIYWKRKGFLEKLIAMMSPQARPDRKPKAAQPGATRIADAMFKNAPRQQDKPEPSLDLDAKLTMSAAEILQKRDFAQMSADEIARARLLIDKLVIPDDRRPTRRFVPDRRGARVDPRRSFRGSLSGVIDLEFRAPRRKAPPIVALCDISGSMAEYTRLFLHFLHALGQTRRASTFLFGTRLTNVTRSLQRRDPDEALARCSAQVEDWSGGTRIAASLHAFNRDWSRRVLGQGAIVLLFTDGLERDGVDGLAAEMQRLSMSCRRLIWLNPLLRFDGFAAKAQGLRAMLPHVDEFRPIHSLASMAELVAALSGQPDESAAPKAWLRAV
ncbi:MAG TPA: VWA domain-containing protein [Roseiarcus sp.]|nr:VWA domain-containing protein [Roseiarcus sp.]